MSKPFFHELTKDQINAEVIGKMTWRQVMEKYDQPVWCNYPGSLEGKMGCWSLTGSPEKICRNFCKTCPEYKPKTP